MLLDFKEHERWVVIPDVIPLKQDLERKNLKGHPSVFLYEVAALKT